MNFFDVFIVRVTKSLIVTMLLACIALFPSDVGNKPLVRGEVFFSMPCDVFNAYQNDLTASSSVDVEAYGDIDGGLKPMVLYSTNKTPRGGERKGRSEKRVITDIEGMRKVFLVYHHVWQYSVDKFFSQYPEFSDDEVVKYSRISYERSFDDVRSKVNAFCESESGLMPSKRLGEMFISDMWESSQLGYWKKYAIDEGSKKYCRLGTGFYGRSYPEFGLSETMFFTICAPKLGGQASRGAIYMRDGKYVDELCQGKSLNQMTCYNMERNRKNVCLSTYGQCMYMGDGQCGWVQSQKSRSCMSD